MLQNKIKKIIKKIIPKKYHQSIIEWKNITFDKYATRSYSQEGEDMILKVIFESKKTTGFYVDVGAYHPMRFSNTYYFYKKGWRGINIDAMPGSMKLLEKIRPKDINLEIAISDKKGNLIYYIFTDYALNSFSKNLSIERNKNNIYKIIQKIKIKASPLTDILDNYLPKNTEIDFLSIDVEGLDLQALRSNNWAKYKPKIILVESLNFSFDNFNHSEIYKFLIDKNYCLLAKTIRTLIFIDNYFKKSINV